MMQTILPISIQTVLLTSSILKVKGSTSTFNSNSNPTFLINESYRHYLNQNEITKLIRHQVHDCLIHTSDTDTIDKYNKNNERKTLRLGIDVSSSLLEDEGMESILDSLELCQEFEQPMTISVSLEARMNRLSPKGVASFFDRLLMSASNAAASDVDADADAAADDGSKEKNQLGVLEEEGDDDGNQGESENVNSAKVTNTTNITDTIEHDENNKQTQTPKDDDKEEEEHKKQQIRHHIYMEYIDLGLNDVGLHGEEEKYKKRSMNALFFKSLRKLIENQSGLSCPQVLRMDNCGLGPPFCRSIGKVSLTTCACTLTLTW